MSTKSNNLTVDNKQLTKQFFTACLVAVILLLTIVLPAEYQIDPLSTGKLLGLDKMSAESSGLDTTPVDVKDDLSTFRLSKSTSLLHTETREVVVEGYEGIELKATMQQGDGFTFDWRTKDGPLYTDMHGEYASDTSKFETYFKEKSINQQQGTFVAPFDGTHGWYWQNMQEDAVTVTITLSGFYSDLHEKQE
mgnify:FL=1